MQWKMMLRGLVNLLKTIWLGLVLIGAAAALLLVSDLDRREAHDPRVTQHRPRIAVMQWTSTDLLDATVAGIVQGLRDEGYEDGRTAVFRFFNASGDSATANLMAREVTGGGYDLVMTASTMALQVVAKANREGRVPHIFGGVTDPYGAGVGITGPEPHQHPPHLAGVGTFQPVDAAIRTAREMNPALKRLGVVWNPAEDNSEACLRVARATCAELDIELLEANAGNSSEVPEAIRSVLGRNVDAVWIGGDTVAIASISAIVSASRAAGVPVFTNDPNDLERGVLMGLGASYVEVGRAVGGMGGQVLRGAKPSSFGVANLVPEVLTLNEELAGTLASWSIPETVRAKSVASRAQFVPVAAAPKRPHEIRIVRYNDAQFSADSERGIREGFQQAGLVEGRDFHVRVLNAQGDMPTLNAILDAVVADQPDLVMAISTPALQACLRKIGSIPVVFCSVGDGVRAGAGTSETDHLPNVTGITTKSPFAGMARLIRAAMPHVKTVGTLFSPSEINSELYRDWFEEALKAEGLVLNAVPVNSSAEVAEATTVLLQAKIDVIGQIADNATRPGYAQIVKRAEEAGLAFLCFDSAGMKDGAALALARDYHANGIEAAGLAVRVLRGESPVSIPFANTRTEVLVINPAVMAKTGLQLPDDLKGKAIVYEP